MLVYDNQEYTRIIRQLPAFVQRDRYGIPVIESEEIDISDINNGKWLTNLSNVTSGARNREHKIVHCFAKDKVLWKKYNAPYHFLEQVSGYYAVASLDFSMDEEMVEAQLIGATFRNRWSGAFLQVHGKRAIPTVGWTTEKFDGITFSGLRDGGTFMISTMNVKEDGREQIFLRGYRELRKRFPHTKLVCVGNPLKGMDDDICYVKFYRESFGSWDRNPEKAFWQPGLFNWDGSAANPGGM